MFNLVRRISRSLIPRPDRPWEEDPTSNAPQIGRKRRLSNTELGGGAPSDEERSTKRGRGTAVATRASTGDSEQDTPKESSPTPPPQSATLEQADVKEVTEGVKEVELEDKKADPVAPESVPLPEELSGELDDAIIVSANVGDSIDELKVDVEKDDVASSRSTSVQPPAVEEEGKENPQSVAVASTSMAVVSDQVKLEDPSTSPATDTIVSDAQEVLPAAPIASVQPEAASDS